MAETQTQKSLRAVTTLLEKILEAVKIDADETSIIVKNNKSDEVYVELNAGEELRKTKEEISTFGEPDQMKADQLNIETARKILTEETRLNSLQISNILGQRSSISKNLVEEFISINRILISTTWGDVLLSVSDICKAAGVNERVKDMELVGLKIKEVIEMDRT